MKQILVDQYTFTVLVVNSRTRHFGFDCVREQNIRSK